MTVGWTLDGACRAALLAQFPPRYSQVVADHVALLGNSDGELPVPVTDARIVGHVDDGHGVEAMVVSLYGSTERYDGSNWYIPWSLEQGRTAAESSELIDRLSWTEIEDQPVRLHPAKW